MQENSIIWDCKILLCRPISSFFLGRYLAVLFNLCSGLVICILVGNNVMSGSSAIWFNLFVVLFVVLCVVHLCFEKKGGCNSHVLFHILGKKSCLVIKGWYVPLQLFVAVKTYVNTWTIILLQIFQYQQDQLAKAKKKREIKIKGAPEPFQAKAVQINTLQQWELYYLIRVQNAEKSLCFRVIYAVLLVLHAWRPAKRQVASTRTLTLALLNLPSGQVVLQVEAFQSMKTWNFYDSNLHALLWLACPVQSANALHRKQLSFQLSGPTRISFTEHSLAIQTDYRNCSLTVQCLSMTWSTFNFFSLPHIRASQVPLVVWLTESVSLQVL